MINSEYNVSQPALYLICRILLDNYKNNIATFSARKARYTQEWYDEKLEQLQAAAAIPDEQARSLEHEMLRLQLVQLGETCCEMFQYSKSYIRTAFNTEEERTANYDACGQKNYTSASHQGWVALDALNRANLAYITANQQTLSMDGENMPDTFITEVTSANNEWYAVYLLFNQARSSARTATENKITANNAIYRTIIDSICADGQLYFKNNEELKRQFSFEAVSEQVAPSGASTAVITVENEETGKPMLAEIMEENTERVITTENDGRGEMGNLSAGETKFKITADGFSDQTVTMSLKTGTTSRITVKMTPMVFAQSSVPAPEPVVSNGTVA